jgi:8-oxo-dGTP pyrophosphatase MutT (NUDIX family)
MFIKVYFGEKPVYLCNKIDAELQEILHHPDAILMDEISSAAINSLLHEIVKDEFHAGVLLHEDLDKLKKKFIKHFQLIEAAGGIVVNEKNQLLFIYRLDKWDLPKGKIEKGEGIETAALREIEEETGLTHLTIKNKIGETYHTYNAFGKHFFKITHWFNVTCSSNQTLVPQTSENIEEIKWFTKKEVAIPLINTYPSIKDILNQYLNPPKKLS